MHVSFLCMSRSLLASDTSALALSVGLLYPKKKLGSGGQTKSSGPGPAGESSASRWWLTGHFFCVNCQQPDARLLLRYGDGPAEALRSYPRAPTLLVLPRHYLLSDLRRLLP